MMTDRELLEMAAKAAGSSVSWPFENVPVILGDPSVPWDPLADDGDALRLACALKINIEHMHTLSGDIFGINCWPHGRGDCGVSEDEGLVDYCAATRRAIVRAAAEIGKDMP